MKLDHDSAQVRSLRRRALTSSRACDIHCSTSSGGFNVQTHINDPASVFGNPTGVNLAVSPGVFISVIAQLGGIWSGSTMTLQLLQGDAR